MIVTICLYERNLQKLRIVHVKFSPEIIAWIWRNVRWALGERRTTLGVDIKWKIYPVPLREH